jgi:trehalose synthase
MSGTEVIASRLDDYTALLGEIEVAELRSLSQRLQGRTVQMVNSTSVGGGVAEILTRVVPLMEELELKVRWDVITGGDDFFAITKAFHNALHGARTTCRMKASRLFSRTQKRTGRG